MLLLSRDCTLQVKGASIKRYQHLTRKEVHMHTDSQLLPGDVIGSAGVVNYQGRGNTGWPAALLHCCSVLYHGPCSMFSQPTLKILIITTVTFTETLSRSQAAPGENLVCWKLSCFSEKTTKMQENIPHRIGGRSNFLEIRKKK